MSKTRNSSKLSTGGVGDGASGFLSIAFLILLTILTVSADNPQDNHNYNHNHQQPPQQQQQAQSNQQPIHPNHRNDESIAVSSSIGVASGGDSGKQDHSTVIGHRGHIEDLLANESQNGDGSKVAPGGNGGHGGAQSLSHASVVDTESDLLGAESEPKFSLSKLKRPFTRMPFDLRFNNRFLNGAASQFMASGSNMMPQIHTPPHHQHGPGPQQMLRQPPNLHQIRPPQPPSINGPMFNGRPQQGPNFHMGGPQPIYKSLPMGPGPNNMPPRPEHYHQGPPPSPSQGQQQHSQHQHQGPPPQQGQQGPSGPGSFAVINHQQAPTMNMADTEAPSDIIHSIADFMSEETNRQNDNSMLNDYDNRQPMTSPSNDIWPLAQPDLAKIINLDVKCEKNFMKVSLEFDRPFNGILFSKGHFSQPGCIHLPAGSGRSHVYFDIRMDSCGTTGNMGSNSLAQIGVNSAGTFFENTVVIQYDPFVQEAWDQARKLRCTWHDQYEKSVSFRPFPVDMVDVVRADFAGDNVGCWMQIQVGRGPWASEVAGIVKIGQTMTMVLAIKDEEGKFDMLVRNCVAHDGKRPPIELVDSNGCIVRSKLMSKFTKIKNFGSSASVLSYAHFQAFKFPDSMEVHFQCTIQICKNSCSEQCDQSGQSNVHYVNHQISGTINTQSGTVYNHQPESLYISNSNGHNGDSGESRDSVLARPREVRDVSKQLLPGDLTEGNLTEASSAAALISSKQVGVNKVIKVVSPGDLSFATSDKLTGSKDTEIEQQQKSTASDGGHIHHHKSGDSTHLKSWLSERINEKICMSSLSFVVCFVTLFALLVLSCTCSAVLCCRRRTSQLSQYGHDSSSSSNCKSAKETSLAKKDQRKHENEYGPPPVNATIVPVMASAHSYLSSTSVLSPRVQATGNSNGYRQELFH